MCFRHGCRWASRSHFADALDRSSAMRALIAASCLLLACPSEVNPEYLRASVPTPKIVPNDPRIVEDTGDLYPATEAAKFRTPLPSHDTHTDDRTDCKAFSPALEHPRCCPLDYGFDPAVTAEACKLPIYLGQSQQNMCNHFFVREQGGEPVAFRVTRASASDPKVAADGLDATLRRTGSDASVRFEPVPGVPGAYWSRSERTNWAFVPGWSFAREIIWDEPNCARSDMITVLRKLASAKQPAELGQPTKRARASGEARHHTR